MFWNTFIKLIVIVDDTYRTSDIHKTHYCDEMKTAAKACGRVNLNGGEKK